MLECANTENCRQAKIIAVASKNIVFDKTAIILHMLEDPGIKTTKGHLAQILLSGPLTWSQTIQFPQKRDPPRGCNHTLPPEHEAGSQLRFNASRWTTDAKHKWLRRAPRERPNGAMTTPHAASGQVATEQNGARCMEDGQPLRNDCLSCLGHSRKLLPKTPVSTIVPSCSMPKSSPSNIVRVLRRCVSRRYNQVHWICLTRPSDDALES